MDLGLSGKTALVTGAAQGLGRAIALRLRDEGCLVAALDMNTCALANLPDMVLPLAADVTVETELQAAVAQMTEAFGGVDILVNNAGVQSKERLPELDTELFEHVLKVNLTGAFMLSRMVLPQMKERGWGRIINMGSMAGKAGGLTTGAAYTASKAGLMGLTKSLAREGAPHVTANALAPAFIETEMTDPAIRAELAAQIPVGRLGTPQEVAAAVAFLASDFAGYITGEVMDINGGFLID
ncbi:SDR family oxidoreductase [bacterium]|nr:SDR family oxidoreductase [bacterium]